MRKKAQLVVLELCMCLCAPALKDKVIGGGVVVIWKIVT